MHTDNTASTVGSPGFHYALGVLPYCSKAPSSSRPATAVCPFRGTPTSTGRSPTPHRRQVSGSRPGPGAGRAAAPPTGASRGAGCHLPPPHSARPLPAGLFPPALLPSLFPSLPRRVEGGAAALPRGRRRALPPRAGERPQVSVASRTCCAGSRRGEGSGQGGREGAAPHRSSTQEVPGLPALSHGDAAAPRYGASGWASGARGVASAGSGSRGSAPGLYLPVTLRSRAWEGGMALQSLSPGLSQGQSAKSSRPRPPGCLGKS